MRWKTMTAAATLTIAATCALADDAPNATATPFTVTLAIEEGATPPAEVRVYTRPSRENGVRRPGVELGRLATTGPTTLDVAALPAGGNFVFFSAPGFASQWVHTTIADGRATPARADVTLHRERWVTIRYAFNPHGPELTADVAPPRVATLTHWDSLPDFGHDWQIWQVDEPRRAGFGPVPMLEFHRVAEGYGFATPAHGDAFNDIDAAPTDATAYTCRNLAATPGLTLICRVNGDRTPPGQLGYGKIFVESVSTTRPADVTPAR